VAGYVFIDSNQNGQRDADEQGVAGVTVNLGSESTVTDENGLYVFAGLAPETYVISLTDTPSGYTTDFPVTLPQSTGVVDNALPSLVQLGAEGIDLLEPEAYRRQVLAPPYTLPQYDANDNRVEPLLNFGLVPIYDVSLWTGECSGRLEKRRDLGAMLNGVLVTTLDSAALNPGYVVDDLLLGSPSYALYIEKHGANNAAGQGVPGVEVIITWASGQESIFTGLKPEIDPGYADFVMSPGTVYTLQVTGGGQIIPDLSSPECATDDGERYAGSWRLIFKHP
jgi:hypothetical protein